MPRRIAKRLLRIVQRRWIDILIAGVLVGYIGLVFLHARRALSSGGSLGTAGILLLVGPALAAALAVVWRVPQWQVSRLPQEIRAKDRAELENKYRATLAQIVGGAAVLTGLYFTWQTFQLDRDGQITDRYIKAVSQLESVSPCVRAGGLFALERITRDSRSDYWTIMEVLTTYVREKSGSKPEAGRAMGGIQARIAGKTCPCPVPPEPNECSPDNPRPGCPTDVQAALTVLGRGTRKPDPPEHYLDLHSTQLSGAYLRGAHLEAADLRESCLLKADLREAYLDDASLEGADLQCADLRGARLSKTNLGPTDRDSPSPNNGAHLENAQLQGSHMEYAYLWYGHLCGTHLEDAYLHGAGLEHADLRGAHLDRAHLNAERASPGAPPCRKRGGLGEESSLPADLRHANMQMASLAAADLRGVDLRGARLADAHLDHANLQGACLHGAHLAGSHLDHANLQGACLDGAYLCAEAMLRRSTSRARGNAAGKSLKAADLKKANVQGASLRNADLRGVDLSSVRNLTREQIESAKTDTSTILPAGLTKVRTSVK